MTEPQANDIQFNPNGGVGPAPTMPQGSATHSLGERLRAAREARGMSLGDVALRTRVPERMLAAIEGDAYDALPHTTFTNGFVRSFAREVGVSEAEAGAQFRSENTHVPAAPSAMPLRPIEIERVPSGRLAIFGVAAAAVIAVAGVVYYATRDRAPTAATTVVADNTAPAAASPPPARTPPPLATTTAIPVVTAPIGTTTAAPVPAAPVGPDTVTLTATQDAWIQIRDRATKQRIMSGVLAVGQSYTVPPGDMTLWTGRAGALQVRVGGKLLAPLGGPAETIRNVGVTAAALAGRPAATATPIG